MRERLADLDRSQLPSVEQAQEMQSARHAERAAGHVEAAQTSPEAQEIERQLKTVSAHIAEPAAPIHDRDAAERAWMEKLEAAAIAGSAEKAAQEPHQRREAAGEGRNTGGAAEAVQTPSEARETAYRAVEPAASEAMADIVHTAADQSARSGEGVLRRVGNIIASFIEAMSEVFAPAPRLTPDQAERAERVEHERAEVRGVENAEAAREAQRWSTIEMRRQQQDEAERDPRLAAMMQLHIIPTARTERETDRDRDYERER
jgi:hypothetical protein